MTIVRALRLAAILLALLPAPALTAERLAKADWLIPGNVAAHADYHARPVHGRTLADNCAGGTA